MQEKETYASMRAARAQPHASSVNNQLDVYIRTM